TPPKAGNWTCRIRTVVRGQQVLTATPFELSVDPGDAPGYVTVHPNQRNFQRDGKMIFPIGHNFAAPEDSVRMYHNYPPGLQPNELNKATDVSTWVRYRRFIENFADSGGHFIRTIQTPWASLIEFEN